jgi:hypothetical protein
MLGIGEKFGSKFACPMLNKNRGIVFQQSGGFAAREFVFCASSRFFEQPKT